MKKTIVLATLAFGWLLAPDAAAQQKGPARALAVAGDTVWVVAYSVKPDKRAQYERFVNQFLWPSAAKLGPADQRAFRQTRVLNPVKPEADGNYAYLFIMDPVQKGIDYSILHLLKKAYGNDKGAEYYKLFTDSVVGGAKVYSSVQTHF
ncbi:MAG: hypothetical protein NVS3B25_13310 [Hymenobacter sp.]